MKDDQGFIEVAVPPQPNARMVVNESLPSTQTLLATECAQDDPFFGVKSASVLADGSVSLCLE